MDGVATLQAECRGGRSPIGGRRPRRKGGCGEVLCYFFYERRLTNFVSVHHILLDLYQVYKYWDDKKSEVARSEC